MLDPIVVLEHALRARLLEERLSLLARARHIGHVPSAQKAELVLVAAALALEPSDWIAPSHRDWACALFRGLSLDAFFRQALGRAGDPTLGNASLGGISARALRILSPSLPSPAHLVHACGLAWAARLRGQREVVLAFTSESGVESGDFHSALNFSGIHRLPVVFVVKNLGVELPRPPVPIREKGIAYGIEGQSCPNEPEAIHRVVASSCERAREGEGPFLIEVELSPKVDPLRAFEQSLINRGLISAESLFALRRNLLADISSAYQSALEALPLSQGSNGAEPYAL
ncbi:MAG: thiamine pyrophosphate-dependent enzyme [Sandaracinaceae bacterium]|nr:thiamine pyrophosphate-dependent enzyme [Sandaracinaceae bacterium]